MRRHHGTDLGGGQDLRDAPVALLGSGGGRGSRPVPSRPRVERRCVAPRRSHGTRCGGGDDSGDGSTEGGSAAPAATRAARGRPLRPSIGTPGPAVFRSVAWRVGWSLGEVAGVRKRALKLLVSYKAARFAEPGRAELVLRHSLLRQQQRRAALALIARTPHIKRPGRNCTASPRLEASPPKHGALLSLRRC